MKKLSLALALVGGLTIAAPSISSACGSCGGKKHYTGSYGYAPRAQYMPTANYCAPAAPVCRPVCRPVCDPCDPCRRSGLFGLGILGIL